MMEQEVKDPIIRRILRFAAKHFVPFALCLIIGLQIAGEYRRDNAVIELKTAGTMTRRMLNSRAQIQIILVNATLEDRKLTAEEIDRIKLLWKKAEYDQIEDVP